MHKLEDFKDEINKCSKCGLCQSVCPIYKLTGNDCAVSRGKFVMLDGVLKGDLKLNKNINKYLDLCLKCDKCSNFCPSAIDVCKIFEAAKYEYVKNTLWGKIVFFLESKYVFGNLLKFAKFAQRITNPHHLRVWRQYFENGASGIDAGAGVNKIEKLLYFKGCVNTIFPQTDKLLHKLFSNSDVEIIEKDFDCCGLPFLSSGNLERFEEVKKHNLELMDCEFDYILTDCASCESTLKKYFNSMGNDVELESPACKQKEKNRHSEGNNPKQFPKNLITEHKILRFAQNDIKFINLGELVAQQNIKFKFEKPVKVTFHKPCHLENDDFWMKIVENCENVEYVKMKDYDECCGLSGEFALKNHKISLELAKQKAKNIIESDADYVVTTCPACVLGLKQGLIGVKNAPKVLSLSEFLEKGTVAPHPHS